MTPMTLTPAVSAKARDRIEAVIRMCGNARDNLRDGNVSAEGTLTAVTGGLESIKYVAGQALAALSTEGEAEPVAWIVVTGHGRRSIIDAQKYNAESDDFWLNPAAKAAATIVPLYAHPPSAPAGVKVKPLEWVKEEDEDWWSAPALGYPDAYAVWVSGLGAVRLRLRREAAFSLFAGTLDEAKAAAQADYEQRIRSSLQPDTLAETASAPAGDIKELASASVRPEPSGVEACDCGAECRDYRDGCRYVEQPGSDGGGVEAQIVKRVQQYDTLKMGDHRRRYTPAQLEMAIRLALAASPAAPAAAGVDAREALKALLDHVDVETCVHEETHRGGFLWTICDQCGRKWADDKGGFVPHTDAPAVARARMICEALPAPAKRER